MFSEMIPFLLIANARLGALASIEAAPRLAELIARELIRDGDWRKQTVRNFKEMAQGYLPPA